MCMYMYCHLLLLQKVVVKASPKIQQLCLNEINVTFHLSVNSSTTENLSTMSSASEIEEALNNLPEIIVVGKVAVILEVQAESWCMYVIFLSQSKTLPTVVMATDTQHETSVIQESSIPLFSLGFGPRITELLPHQIEPSDLESNITQLFSTVCSRSITGSVFFADTYENDVPRFNNPVVDNSVEALCGRYSVRNPRHVYYVGQSRDELTEEVYVETLTIGSNPNRNEYRYVSKSCMQSLLCFKYKTIKIIIKFLL